MQTFVMMDDARNEGHLAKLLRETEKMKRAPVVSEELPS